MFKKQLSILFVITLWFALTIGLGTKAFAAGYPITEELIHNNRSGESLSPQGFVIHSTDDPGANAQAIHDYWDSQYAGSSAHYVVDDHSIIRTIPENEVAWHVGPTGNHKFLGVEMTMPATHNQAYFNETYNRTVWLVADAMKRYGWNINDIYSHHMISNMWPAETDGHTDPDEYLAEYGKTFDQMRADIQATLNQLNAPPAPPAPQPVVQKSAPKTQPVVNPEKAKKVEKAKKAEEVQNNGYIEIFGRWVWQAIAKVG